MPLRNVTDQGLKPMIPPFSPDLQGALALIGQKEQYIVQLQAEMMRRGDEANALDDRRIELEKQVTQLQDELASARAKIAELAPTHPEVVGTVELTQAGIDAYADSFLKETKP